MNMVPSDGAFSLTPPVLSTDKKHLDYSNPASRLVFNKSDSPRLVALTFHIKSLGGNNGASVELCNDNTVQGRSCAALTSSDPTATASVSTDTIWVGNASLDPGTASSTTFAVTNSATVSQQTIRFMVPKGYHFRILKRTTAAHSSNPITVRVVQFDLSPLPPLLCVDPPPGANPNDPIYGCR